MASEEEEETMEQLSRRGTEKYIFIFQVCKATEPIVLLVGPSVR